jgi:hypothetical protein
MSVFSAILIGILMGTVFGFALEKSRVFEPGMIVGQMQLRNFIMLKVFLTAVAVGALVLAVMTSMGWASLHPKGALYVADVIGGLILGAGIALAGACPGTVLAQIGAGYRDALFVLAGGIAGATFYGYLDPVLAPLLKTWDAGKITFADSFGLPYWFLAVLLAVLIGVVLFILEKVSPWRVEMGADVDGDLAP